VGELAVKPLEGWSWASVTVVRDTQGHLPASPDPVAARADARQHELNDGPCLQAEDDTNYLLSDVADEPRRARFARASRFGEFLRDGDHIDQRAVAPHRDLQAPADRILDHQPLQCGAGGHGVASDGEHDVADS